jgi:Zn ribbon nucleic-acid-binding protein
MQVKIGKVAAVCPVCKQAEFRSPVKRPNQMDVLTCAKCGIKYTYVFLLDQIARQSIAQSDDALSASRNRKPPDNT